ncbi:MAG: SGNH/GDSL hydrolase family protein [Deltaproteobacteria bacterium]|nr:SGNH/GDSL hydrolase family protein [Deltaproteobacteria bacterium]
MMRTSQAWAVRDGLRLSSAVLVAACFVPLGGCSGGTATADVTDDGPAEVEPDARAEVEPDAPADVAAEVAEDTVEDAPAVEAAVEDAAAEDAEEEDGTGEVTISERCFGDIWDPGGSGPYYDAFEPVIGSHCLGTNHQDIRDVRRVVFLGDSVTSGTPPTLSGQYYRSVLADALTARFGLAPPSLLWKMVNVLDGTSLQPMSGDFGCCSKWGARTDDLMRDNSQVLDCLPDSERFRATLVIMTVGGNDIASIRQRIADGDPLDDIWTQTREFVGLVEETVHWLVDDPTRFPYGVYVIFANMFEFTDGTGDIGSCTAADLGGFGAPIADPVRAEALEDMVIWANEQYMRIAVETHTDMILMLEHFCGHGFHSDDPATRCYRGPGTERWFDLTCIHPNPTGHSVIADMFLAVVDE